MEKADVNDMVRCNTMYIRQLTLNSNLKTRRNSLHCGIKWIKESKWWARALSVPVCIGELMALLYEQFENRMRRIHFISFDTVNINTPGITNLHTTTKPLGFFLDNLSLKQSDLSMLLLCKFLVLKQTLFLILVFHKSVFQHPSSFHLHRWNNQMTDCKWLGLEARLVDVFSVFRYLGTDVDQLPLSQYANGVN